MISSKIEKIKDLLYGRKEIIFAYLYGSMARKTDNQMSDIDLAIYLDKEHMPDSGPFGYRSELIVELQSGVNQEIDLVVLNDVSLSLKHNVLKDGKLIFCKSEEERVAFHAETMRKYLDFLPMIKVQEKYLDKRLKEERYGR